jgi:signal transduction histidine kinase
MSKPPRRPRTYRTWAVFTLAMSLLMALMLVPALTARRRSEQIYRDIRSSQTAFQTSQRVFEALSQDVFTISVTIREFLLDNSPEAGRTYRRRLDSHREQLQTNIVRLREILPPGEGAVLQELERELGAYWDSVLPIFDWTPAQRTERGAYFLRGEQRPRRQSILAVAEELADINASLYEQQQRQTTESERRFRDDLDRSVLFALLSGVLVSAAGILRIRWLERRAQQQHEEAQQTGEEMRNLSVRLRHAQEEERRTISRELHDDVGQKLTAMRMELGALARPHAIDATAFSTRLTEVKDLAEQSLRTIRDIATGLRPSVLDDLGLGAALQKQAREFSNRTGTPVQVSVEGGLGRLADRQRTYVYRIVQEALTNCAKHARARQITIRLVDRDSHIELLVMDDGSGFDPVKAAHSGLGLIGIEERVRELGGIIAIRSAPNQGTTIDVTIPLNGKDG